MLQMPWDRKTVPHCVLELTDACNLTCKACYRQRGNSHKDFSLIREELQLLEENQTIQTVSLAGGEPTLHPELVEIVNYIHLRGHKVSLVTNAVALSDNLLAELANAGLDVIMLHVDEGQDRDDLPEDPTVKEINDLRHSLAKRVAKHGIDAGLCVTIYPETIVNLPSMLDCVIESPTINYVFATHSAPIEQIAEKLENNEKYYVAAQTFNSDVIGILKRSHGITPFAFIPPRSPGLAEMPCISYFIPVRYNSSNQELLAITGNRGDALLLKLSRLLTRRYMYYCKNRKWMNVVQITVNALAAGTLGAAFSFLRRAIINGERIHSKRMVFENSPVITSEGKVNCCDFCPNSTVRDSKVVPVCLADHITDEWNKIN